MSSAKKLFRATMAERRSVASGSAEWRYLTKTARKLAWLAFGKPTKEWDDE